MCVCTSIAQSAIAPPLDARRSSGAAALNEPFIAQSRSLLICVKKILESMDNQVIMEKISNVTEYSTV
jgi:hypothetical protein